MNRPENNEIIEKYLNRFSYSPDSRNMRSSSLNGFFKDSTFDDEGNMITYGFNYKKHIFDIQTNDIIDYFDKLNNLKNVCLTTKKNKFTILKSFLEFCMEYYDFMVKIPKKTIKWQQNHTKAESNKDVIASIEEIQKILSWLKENNPKNYLLFRLLSETGMRLGELLSIKITDLNLNHRLVNTIGKTGEKIYFYSEELSKLLKIYLTSRKELTVNTEALFLNMRLKPYKKRTIQFILNGLINKLGIEKQITPHTFRRTLNTLRKKLGCDNEKAKLLLGHKTNDVNEKSYTKYTDEEKLEFFDKYNPFINIEI